MYPVGRLQLAIVIPAFNEAATISEVVATARSFGQVIVVDDASTDQTGELARQAGGHVLRNEHNLQYDGSLSAGLNEAIRIACEYALTLDADGQHDPDDIQKFLAAMNQGADIVIGIRPRAARFAEWLFRIVGKCLWGIQDPLCGMKAYRLAWVKGYGIVDTRKSIGTGLAIKMVQDNAKLVQVPISIRDREDEPRFGGIVKANIKILKAMFLCAFKTLYYYQ
jgi:glycosyltransferase involved in cell wall biosynthesis